MANRSRRLTVTPGRFSGALLPARFSFHRLTPMSHSARACIAEVFPELFGPMNTTGFPSSTSTSPKRLKLRMVSLVSIRYLLDDLRWACRARALVRRARRGGPTRPPEPIRSIGNAQGRAAGPF